MVKILRSMSLVCLFLVVLSGTASALSDPNDVWVTDNGVTTMYMTPAEVVSSFLESENIVLAPNDTINVSLDEKIIPNYVTKIIITRSFNVDVYINGVKETVNVTPGTRAGTLAQLLGEKYKTEYMLDLKPSQVLTDVQSMSLQSSKEHDFVTTEAIVYETIFEMDPMIEKGKIQVMQPGELGEKRLVTTVTMVQGQADPEEIITETVVKEPITRIVHQGTKEPPVVVDTKQQAMDVVDTYNMNASAYTAGPESTGKQPGSPGYGITASGMKAQHGVVAVDPKVIPLGTKLFIEGYGYAIAGDTGGAIKGHHIDLFYEDLNAALQFGRRQVTVHVLAE